MTYRLMMDRVQIGVIRFVAGEGYSVVGYDNSLLPDGLFKVNELKATHEQFTAWIEERVFPEERMGCNELLVELGLKAHIPIEIAKKTRACLMEDPYWVAFEETDTYEQNTIRGLMGVHPCI